MVKADIISIGDELLIGQTLNTNAYFMAQELTKIGVQVRKMHTVADEEEEILTALKEAEQKVSIILITGGLGPTNDDKTLGVLNHYYKGNLVLNETVLNDIKNLLNHRNKLLNENNRNQALVPDNAIPIRNFKGTAPGICYDLKDQLICSLPGVPHEMKAMMLDFVFKKIKEKFKLPVIVHQMVYTCGIAEAVLAEKLTDWEKALPNNIKLAYLPSPSLVKLRLSSTGDNKEKIQQQINSAVQQLYEIIPKYIYSTTDEKLEKIIGKILRNKQYTLATAESCTGGYIAHLITSISGSSDYFKGSIVAYSNQIKEQHLGVSSSLLNNHGAVSEEVVTAMVIGIQEKFKTDCAIAVSGVAGPTGGTKDKPVGTVWCALLTPKGIKTKLLQLGNDDRARIIHKTAIISLNLLRLELLED